MRRVLDKDIIENEILSHLSIAKCEFKTKSFVNADAGLDSRKFRNKLPCFLSQ